MLMAYFNCVGLFFMFVLADRPEWAAEYVPEEWKDLFVKEAYHRFMDREHREGLTWEQAQWYLHFLQELGEEVDLECWKLSDDLPMAANCSPVFPGQDIRVNKEHFVARAKMCWRRGESLTWKVKPPAFLDSFLFLRPKEKSFLSRLLEKL